SASRPAVAGGLLRTAVQEPALALRPAADHPGDEGPPCQLPAVPHHPPHAASRGPGRSDRGPAAEYCRRGHAATGPGPCPGALWTRAADRKGGPGQLPGRGLLERV